MKREASREGRIRCAESMAAPPFLDNRGLQLLIFGGKGGVGKTTCATATALQLAKRSPESSFLLVSTDPAHSLTDSLAGLLPPDNLKVFELDAREYLATFKKSHHDKLREIASRGTFLDDDEISRFLDLSLPGLDELMAFLEISAWVENRSYDCIIVDTAPSGHTLRLLAMPEFLRKWLDMLETLLAKHRYMKWAFTRSNHRDELDTFLEELAASVKRMEELLQDSVRCRFVPVMLAEAMSIRETVSIVKEVDRLKLPMTDIVINRLYPDNRLRGLSGRTPPPDSGTAESFQPNPSVQVCTLDCPALRRGGPRAESSRIVLGSGRSKSAQRPCRGARTVGGSAAQRGGRRTVASARDYPSDLCGQGWRGKDDPGLRHSPATGAEPVQGRMSFCSRRGLLTRCQGVLRCRSTPGRRS